MAGFKHFFSIVLVVLSISSMAQGQSKAQGGDEADFASLERLVKWTTTDLSKSDALADSLFSRSLSPEVAKKYYAQLLKLGVEFSNNSRYNLCIKHAERCRTYFEQEGDSPNYITSLRICGSAHVFLSNHKEALKLLSSCSALLDQQPSLFNYREIINVHIHKGIMYGMQKNAPLALEQFSLADSFCFKAADLVNQASIAGYMGNVYHMVGQNEKSFEYNKKSKEILVKLGQLEMATATCDNMATALSSLDRQDEALEILREGKGYAIASGDQNGLATNYTITAEVLTELSRFNEADSFLNQALVIHKKQKNLYGQLQVRSGMIQILHERRDFDALVIMGERLLKISDSINMVPYRTTAHYNLWQAYDSLDNTEKAYHHVAWYYWLRDSTTRQNFNTQVATLQNEFDTELKTREIELLKNEASLASEREKRKSSFNKFLAICLFTLVAVSGILIYFLVRLRNSGKEILHQKQALEKTDKEKAVLLKELHHRVKNNLQIVSSLLNLQSDSVKDAAAQEAFKEGQNRVDAMAMIHKHLYATDELTSVDISTYLDRLVQSLAYSYGFGKKNFILNTDISKEPVDVDIAIPLGLIVNELVSNTFKHAFKEVAMAEITIKLHYDNDQISLLIKDNGKGLPKEFSVEDSASFGLELVQTLVHQLKGRISFENQNGAMFAIEIDHPKTLAA